MYWYDSSGGVEFENRDVVNELCEQHGEESSVEALKKAGYTVAMSVGKYGTALIDLFFAQGDEEFSGIALMWMGEGCECYVFREVHAGMVFMKEFSPMIAAILQAESLVKAG